MDFQDYIKILEIDYRDEQKKFAKKIEQIIKKEKIGLLQADTGIGKSLGYLIPSINYVSSFPKKRVIVAIGTISLIKQISTDIQNVLTAIHQSSNHLINFKILIGKQNYISQERFNKRLESAGSKFQEENKDLIEKLLHWRSTIDEFEEAYGPLPKEISPQLICQNDFYQEDNYQLIKEEALEADILVTTHAMLATDILTGGLALKTNKSDRDSVLIVDEADHFYDVMASLQEKRLNLVDFYFICKSFLSPHSLNKIKDIQKQVSVLSEDRKFNSTPEVQEKVTELLKTLKKILKPYQEDIRAERALEILNEVEHGYPSINGVGVSNILKEPAIVFLNPFVTRKVGKYLDFNFESVVFISATLSISQDVQTGSQWLIKDFSLTKERVECEEFSPRKFGKITLNIADNDFPNPFLKDDETISLNGNWVKSCAEYINGLDGNTLVLTASHQETNLLSKMINRKSIVHYKGSKLSHLKKSFISNGGVLITPAGHAGLNIRNHDGGQILKHVIITRIPFAPQSESLINELTRYLKESGLEESAISISKNLVHRKVANAATRKLKQAIGRGVRSSSDEVEIHILDPRFPKPNEKSRFSYLRNAIPKRFNLEFLSSNLINPKSKPQTRSEPKKKLLVC